MLYFQMKSMLTMLLLSKLMALTLKFLTLRILPLPSFLLLLHQSIPLTYSVLMENRTY